MLLRDMHMWGLQGLIIADFEAEVEDAIETIFRRGDVSLYELLKHIL
jgi:hypothetical protein